MAGVGLTLTLTKRSRKDVESLLRSVTPSQNRDIWNIGLTRMALLVANDVKLRRIAKGGGPVKARQLTSRTYTLAGSITADFSQLPRASEVIAPVPYAAVHEYGGRYHPKRPFLKPALNAQQKRFGSIMVRVINEEMATR